MEHIKIINESGDRKYFTIIPNYILNHSDHWDREVYIQMKRITGENGQCWTSQKTLAKQCGMSVNRLKKSIKYLLDHNWIKFVKEKQIGTGGGLQKIKVYKVIDLWKKNINHYESKGVSPETPPAPKGVSPDDTKGYHETTKGVSPESYKEEPYNNNHIKKNQLQPQVVEVKKTILLKDLSLEKQVGEIIEMFKPTNPNYKVLFKRKPQREAVKRLLEITTLETLTSVISNLPKINKQPYFPTITTPYMLCEKWASLISAIAKNQEKQNKSIIAKI